MCRPYYAVRLNFEPFNRINYSFNTGHIDTWKFSKKYFQLEFMLKLYGGCYLKIKIRFQMCAE